MNLDFVYGERNKVIIKLRKAVYLSLRVASRGAAIAKLKKRTDDRKISSVALVLPDNGTPVDFGDALNRLAWFIGNKVPKKLPAVTVVGPECLADVLPDIPPSQRNFMDRIERYDFVSFSDVDLSRFDAVMLWRARSALNPRFWSGVDRWHIGDPDLYSGSDFGNGIRIAKNLSTKRPTKEIAALSKRNFERLFDKYHDIGKSVVLGTGPSLSDLDLEKLKGRSVIACNAIVKNVSLLEKLKPAAICFADPVFHIGPSEYAATFRDDLVRAVKQFGCFAVTLSDTVDLLLRHYPELETEIIGVDVSNQWSIPTADNLVVRSTSNILTMLMLPVAASLADDIWIGGCDGRKKEENYFWKHNSGAQYEGLMKDAFLTHPSFFRDRVYSDYYEEHCRLLEDQLTFYEQKKKKFQTITPSFIPALKMRQ